MRAKQWVEQHLKAANKILAPHGVRLRGRQEEFTPLRCDLLTRAHRHAMARHLTPHLPKGPEVTVLVLRKVRDLDVPDYNLMGVHWRYRGGDKRFRGRRYILLTARARPPVLAHELCHFFGLRHDPAGGNLMTPGPSSPLWKGKGKKPAPFAAVLTTKQARRLKRGIKRFLVSARGGP